MHNHCLIKIIITIIAIINLVTTQTEEQQPQPQQQLLPPCRLCKLFSESYLTLYKRYNERLYINTDFAICSDVAKGYQPECRQIVDKYHTVLEKWWDSKKNNPKDFHRFFCIETAKQCCPDLHYGPECKPCPGYPDNICYNNGKCKGSGTRKGNGLCTCEVGYTGDYCEKCAPNYYESYRDEKKLLCSKCHQACDGDCTKAGPEGCQKCNPGWIWSEQQSSCIDINECAIKSEKPPCKKNQFCINEDGTYKCLECDRSCNGCYGDGPDMCKKCAENYIKYDKMCVDKDTEMRKRHVSFTRYLTYFGLCIATFIIFKKNTTIAAIIGIAVALYISASEYILNTPPQPNMDDLTKQLSQQIEF